MDFDKVIPNFQSNEDFIKDKQRALPYIEAIKRNKHLFLNKIVLDLNCGVGLLLNIALQSGAKHVYGANANAYTHQILIDNNIDKSKITLFDDKIESIQLDTKVDIILSQWMGNILIYNSHIEDVIYARDKYLAENGIIMPDKGMIYLQTLEDGKYKDQKQHFWDSVYGVNMQSIQKWAQKEPLLESVRDSQLNGDPCLIFELNLNTCKVEDLSFCNSYSIKINDTDFVTGIIAWFQVVFSHCHLPITITQGPSNKPYWKPAIFYLEDELPVRKNDRVKGSFAVKYNKDYLDIKISCHFQNQHMISDFRLN